MLLLLLLGMSDFVEDLCPELINGLSFLYSDDVRATRFSPPHFFPHLLYSLLFSVAYFITHCIYIAICSLSSPTSLFLSFSFSPPKFAHLSLPSSASSLPQVFLLLPEQSRAAAFKSILQALVQALGRGRWRREEREEKTDEAEWKRW